MAGVCGISRIRSRSVTVDRARTSSSNYSNQNRKAATRVKDREANQRKVFFFPCFLEEIRKIFQEEQNLKIRNLDFQRNQQQHPQKYPVHQRPPEIQEDSSSLGSTQVHYQIPQLLQKQQQQYGQQHQQQPAVNPDQTQLLVPNKPQNTEDHAKHRQRMGMKSTEGEIIQVQGGHIVRSTGRKDRHSKVYTAKGPRDRRVRLSAHTAIQFYDVQDRLGYDRPSKAVDWLIKKAKTAIDKLAELPPSQPTGDNTKNTASEAEQNAGGTGAMAIAEQSESSAAGGYSFQLHRQLGGGGGDNNPSNDSSFIDPDAIPETLKSFFPTRSTASSMNFQSYPHENLGLSLHSFQDQGLIHGQPQADTSHAPSNSQTLFVGSAQMGFDASFQRMVAGGGGFAFNPQPIPPALLGQGSAFSQRGPLQSSFMQSIRGWNDLSMASTDHHRTQEIHPSLIFGSRFASEGLPGFSIPARIHGEEEQSVVSDRPSSSSLNSQH